MGVPGPATHRVRRARRGRAPARLDFEPPDRRGLPCAAPRLRRRTPGGVAPTWLSAANEVAVAAFLHGRLPWVAIAEVIEEVLAAAPNGYARYRRRRVGRRCRGPSPGAGRHCPPGCGMTTLRRHGPRIEPASARRPCGVGGEPDRRGSVLVVAVLVVGVRAPSGSGGTVAVMAAVILDDHVARARPLRDGSPGRHEGHRVLPRLRPASLVGPQGRHRVRHQGHPGRRLRARHRHEQPRRGRTRGRALHVPLQGLPGPPGHGHRPARSCTSCSPSCS